MEITDIHAHVFPDKIAGKAAQSIGDFYGIPMECGGTYGQLKDSYLKCGIARGVIHSVAVTPKSVHSINSFIAECVKSDPDMFTGFAAIHPDCVDFEAVIAEALSLGLKGFKLHPDMQRFALDDAKSMDMFAALEGRMPVIIHTGDKRYGFSNPDRMKRVLDAFPRLKCVCAHLGGWSVWTQAWQTLASYENVYVDTSSTLYALSCEEARNTIRKFDKTRVLFGTDYPMWDPAGELKRFEALGLSDDENERILFLNAGRFLASENG